MMGNVLPGESSPLTVPEPVQTEPAESESARAMSARLLLRFAIGVAELGGERLTAALRRFDAEERLGAASVEPPAPVSGRHVVLGALCAAPEWLSHKLHPNPSLVPVRRPGNRLGRLVRRAPGMAWAERHAAELGALTRAQLARWAELGVREEQVGRDLARRATGQIFANAMAKVADSPELQQVIEQQSGGLTASAMNDLRESSARADRMVESVAGRLLHRRSR
jgi:hypothetical protein